MILLLQVRDVGAKASFPSLIRVRSKVLPSICDPAAAAPVARVRQTPSGRLEPGPPELIPAAEACKAEETL